MGDVLTFVAGVVIGALSSWFITHRYYLRASADQRAELQRLSQELRPRNTLRDFEDLLETSTWTKTHIDDTEVWICDANNTFQIEQGERTRDFNEPWTTVYPDRNSSAYRIYLKIGGIVIKELTFISMDGGRIFVPMVGCRPANGGVEYFWNSNSLEVKLCRVIGSYYIYNSLEGVAEISKVSMIE